MATWVGYPRSYTAGRARAPQFVTLHYTAGSEGPSSAENGAAYDKSRTDGTSCHYFVDSSGPALQEVPDGDRSHSALFHGNEIGIHIELCGTVQTRAQWLDPTSYATLVTAAALVREICQRHGFALRRLTVAETRAAYYGKTRPTGINDHATITAAFPEDGGTHTDVGNEFPWDVFMALVTGGADSGQVFPGGSTSPQVEESESDMPMYLLKTPAGHQYRGDGLWYAPIMTGAELEGWQNLVPPERRFELVDLSWWGRDVTTVALAGSGGSTSGPVDYDRIEKIVDRQNDQQSAGGADKD